MFTVLLLTTLLAADPQITEATSSKPEELALAGSYKEALDGFRQRAAADPGDIEARVWIGWVHERMGHPELAEPVYRSVVMEAPGHVDAAMGLAGILTKQKHYEEAIRVLERAKSTAPMNADLLIALGNAHLRLNRKSELGHAYLEMAAALSPESAQSNKQSRRGQQNPKTAAAAAVVAGS
jgi:tetratricopeptide (TPR) repeat protein